MHQPGIEPGSVPWEDTILQLDHWCLLLTVLTFIFAGVVKGHEGKFSIYIYTFKERPVHISPHFYDREIHSDKVTWGRTSMVDAEKRLLVNALEDPENQHFVLLSERY